MRNVKRRQFIQGLAIGGFLIGGGIQRARGATAETIQRKPRRSDSFALEEVSIATLQERMANGSLSAVSLTREYLRRIESLDRNGPRLNSVIELNPEAVAIADGLDRERKARGPRGPLHGMPILIKDNIDTHDRMTTTAGSLALEGSIAPRDSFVAERLRAAGAVILGKTNLSEGANFRGSRSISGWSGRGGLTRNPYVTVRSASGSSSGSAVAVSANLCVAAVGTETNGSIVSPASYCGVVGIKPTIGLISRSGIIPIAASQDTAGPMARSVADAKARCVKWSQGLEDLMTGQKLDAIVAPTGGPAHVLDLVVGDRGLGGSSTYAAVAGLPNITVPCGDVFGLPVGLSFFGRAWSEPRLIALAYSFEGSCRARKPPRFLPTLVASRSTG